MIRLMRDLPDNVLGVLAAEKNYGRRLRKDFDSCSGRKTKIAPQNQDVVPPEE
ncbi:hypothetical protein SAMN04488028_101299 [Reichenbachiella agariperforans]|uniref:Uncharacterized protein n=1 Tax=Reichenbachiella agariperforans TaxID=156994 RepID=A0A1M6JS20_REIAG|nr:hypothetical protein SAMN04488028_101299 [Reichenbachiella agariperforans]